MDGGSNAIMSKPIHPYWPSPNTFTTKTLTMKSEGVTNHKREEAKMPHSASWLFVTNTTFRTSKAE